MAEICKNCTGEIALNFCPNCGQKKSKRIDKTYIKDEIQYTLLHMNKGFFYSLKNLLKAPGTTAREYLEGNRVNHYKPILLVFVISGLSAFISHTFIHPEVVLESFNQPNNVLTNPDFNNYIYKYQSLIMLASTPLMAFFTWLFFKKWGYNYYENIVINAFYFACLQTLSIIIILPIQYLLRSDPFLFLIIPTVLTFILLIGVTLWFYIDLYKNKSAGDVIVRLLFLALFMMVLYVLVIIAIVVISRIMGIDPRTIFPTS